MSDIDLAKYDGRISEVFARADHLGRVEHVQFQLDSGDYITVEADGSDDTVKLGGPPIDELDRVDVSEQLPWSSLIGGTLMWLWTMTNQQGYEDGFQIQVRREQTYSTVELVVVASSFDVYDLAPWRNGTRLT